VNHPHSNGKLCLSTTAREVMIAYDEILDGFWVVLSWTDFLYSIPDSIATKKMVPGGTTPQHQAFEIIPQVLFATGCRLVTCPC